MAGIGRMSVNVWFSRFLLLSCFEQSFTGVIWEVFFLVSQMVLEGKCERRLCSTGTPFGNPQNKMWSLPVLGVVIIMDANPAWVSFLFSENRLLEARYSLL